MDEKYTLTQLKEMGFSKSMIDKHFPNPILCQNPMYKKAPPMKLYDRAEVDAFVQSEEFQAHLKKREKRVKSALAVAAQKREETLQSIDYQINKIHVKRIDLETLEALALDNKWYFHYQKGEDFDVGNVDEKTKHRWMVNYIRHQLTDYDEMIDYNKQKMKGHVGVNDLYYKYKDALMTEIERVYPELFDYINDKKVIQDSNNCEEKLECVDNFEL